MAANRIFNPLLKLASFLLASTPERTFNNAFQNARFAVSSPIRAVRIAPLFANEADEQSKSALSCDSEMHETGMPLNVISSNTAILGCESSGEWQKAISLLQKMQTASVTPNAVSFSISISMCENCGQWEQALKLLDEMHKECMTLDGLVRRRQHIFLRSNRTAFFHGNITVDSAEQWNTWVQEFFPAQPALRINQLDLLDQNANPDLTKFWMALQTSLKACRQEGSEFLYSMQHGGLRYRDNQDAKEQWYLASQDEIGESRERVEMLSGLQSVELPAEGLPTEYNFTALRVPAVLLRAYKLELMNFILRERVELASILERQKKQRRNNIQVKWEHRVLRRTFDGDLVKQQKLRFHRDVVPEDIEYGVLWTGTVLTVLENYDPHAQESPQGSSVERAGTVFKLDTLFGSGKRVDPHHFSQEPQQGDGFMYWHSRSNPGTATIFSNSDDASCSDDDYYDYEDEYEDDYEDDYDYDDDDDEPAPVQYSWTPQMWHSVANVAGRNTSLGQMNRSRTILQTKITFCSSPAASREDEIIERLKIIGLEPYLNETVEYIEQRILNGMLGPRTFEEFLDWYGDVKLAMAQWEAAASVDAQAPE